MSFSDPHWAFVAPAYAVTAATFIVLAIFALVRLMRASQAARREDEQ
ncbi:MAG: heme exporter protein CcmD [Caulobacterales bacterium]